MRRWRWGSNHKSCVRQMVLSIAQREWVLTFLMIRPRIYCSDGVGFKPSHDKTDRLGPCICCSEGCGPLIVLNEKTIHVMMS